MGTNKFIVSYRQQQYILEVFKPYAVAQKCITSVGQGSCSTEEEKKNSIKGMIIIKCWHYDNGVISDIQTTS